MSFPKYPAYKDSGVEWLGSVPSHWDVKPVKHLVSCNDEVLPENTISSVELRYIEISDVTEIEGVRNVQNLVFGEAPSRARRKVHEGDIIVSTVRTYLKAIAQIDARLADAIVSTGFAVLRPTDDIDSSFLAYFARSPYFLETIVAYSVGVSYPAINASDILDIKLPFPPLAEQRAIAAFLDAATARIDALVAKQQALIATLQEKRRALISHVVTKGLDPAAPMRDSGVPWLGAVPAHWEVKPIKYLVEMESGGTPDKSNLEYWDGTVPWASAKDLKIDLLRDTEDHISQFAIDSGAASLVAEESVIIVVRGMILVHTLPVSINLVPLAINQDLKALHPGDSLLARFLAWVLRGLSDAFLARTDTAGHGTKALRTDDWNDIELGVPSLEEQRSITDYIERETVCLDTLIAKAQAFIVLSREHRTALIAAAVTGQIDVRGWAAGALASV